jgi:hypothetical protein
MLILLGTLRSECVVGKNYRLQDIQLSKSRTCENLVENTGLEPVTSWLQTRRSPS